MQDQRLIRRAIYLAMKEVDTFAIQIDYTDESGVKTRRIVSPIRQVDADRFDALCLCREEPRSFCYSRVSDVVLIHASEVQMPAEIVVL